MPRLYFTRKRKARLQRFANRARAHIARRGALAYRLKNRRISHSIVSFNKSFPKSMMAKLKWTQKLTSNCKTGITLLAGNDISSIYSGYSGVDGTDMFPQIKIATQHGQPIYSDVFNQIYSYWYVLGSKIRIRILPSNQQQVGAAVSILPSNSINVASFSDKDFQENEMMTKGCRYIPSTSFQAGISGCNLKHYASTKSMFGVKNVTDNIQLYGQGMTEGSSSPTWRWFWRIMYKAMDAADVTTGTQMLFTYFVDMTFYVKYTQLHEFNAPEDPEG